MIPYTRYIKTIFACIVLLSSSMIAQDILKEDNTFEGKEYQGVQLSQIRDMLFQTNDASSQFFNESSSSIFIEQIGTGNVVNSAVNATLSDMVIVQNGNENMVDIEASAEEVNKTITQLGNNNSVVDFSFQTIGTTNLELIQEGDNLIFEQFGSNELSKYMKFRMTGDSQTIIVRSF